MAVTEYTKSNVTKYCVYVNIRSRTMPHIRFQKRIKGIKSKAEANRKEKKVIQDLSQKVAHVEGHGLTWEMIISRWAGAVLSDNEFYKDYSPTTVRDYISMLHLWTKGWLKVPASQITRGDGKEVLKRVIFNGKSKSFQKRLKNTINMIFNWAIEEKLIKGVHSSPVYGIKISIKSDKKPEILTKYEIQKLLFEAKGRNHNWYYIWAVALLTGMRNGELFALKWKNIDFTNQIITVESSYNFKAKIYKDTKAGYWRIVPISSELSNLLLKLKKSSDGDYVLPRYRDWTDGKQARVLKEFCRNIGLPEIKFHTLRACFATQLLGAGVEPVKVMKICGWKDLKTLAVYLRLAGIDERGVTEELDFLSPKLKKS